MTVFVHCSGQYLLLIKTQEYGMSNAVSPDKLRKAPIASACFMGLGQVLFLKQYLRGFILMAVEAVFIFAHGAIFKGLTGLVTLGEPHPELPVKMRDHSIFMMINGLIVVIILAIFVVVYIANIVNAKKDAEKIIKNGEYPTLRETRNDLAQNSFAVSGITPAIIMVAFFTVIPLLFSALVAFTNYSSPDHIPPNSLVNWVGLENFKTMFVSSYGGAWAGSFVRVAVWTIVWAVFSTFSCFFAGFFFAVVLQDRRIVLPKLYRTIFILPYAIPQMLSLFVWANLLNGTFGPINRTLMHFDVIAKAIPWLSDPLMAKVSLILVNIWIGFPYSMILITSSMTAISKSLYEATTIDGANKWQQFRNITFPLVMYQLKPILIMQFAGNINNFGAVFFLTGGGPALRDTIATQAGSTDILISWIYKLTMNTPNMYNLASVLSILVFIVLVPFALYNFIRTKSFKESEI
jgi:ABC-type sugar transport system permease subunit